MYTIKIHNVETNEVIEREMNAEEIAQLELDKSNAEAQLKKETEQIQTKLILLNKLGITEEEARLLLS